MKAAVNSNRILRNLFLTLGAALSVAYGANAQTALPATAPRANGERFLVVIETSAATQKRAENIQKLVGQLIASGLKGRMHPGDTIGLWTYGEQFQTGQFPLRVWTQNTRQQVALAMVQFLQQQRYEKSPHPDLAWTAMTNVVANSERITVVLITSGINPVIGTPFDFSISENFKRNAEEMQKENMPFLTFLRALNGKFIGFTVNTPPWPIEIPEYPDRPRTEVAAENSAPAAPVAAKPPPKKFDRSVLSPTNTIYLAETSSPAPVPTAEPTPAVVPPATPAVPESTNSPVLAKTTPEILPTPETTKPVEVAEPISAATDKPAGKFPIVTLLVAGIAVLLAVMVLFIALLRWSRHSTGASLITHSMNREE